MSTEPECDYEVDQPIWHPERGIGKIRGIDRERRPPYFVVFDDGSGDGWFSADQLLEMF